MIQECGTLNSTFNVTSRIVVTIIKKNNKVKIRSGREEVFNAGISRLPVLLNFPITSFLRTF